MWPGCLVPCPWSLRSPSGREVQSHMANPAQGLRKCILMGIAWMVGKKWAHVRNEQLCSYPGSSDEFIE